MTKTENGHCKKDNYQITILKVCNLKKRYHKNINEIMFTVCKPYIML